MTTFSIQNQIFFSNLNFTEFEVLEIGREGQEGVKN